jgi:hypothetical protein
MEPRTTISRSRTRGLAGTALGLILLAAIGCTGDAGDPAPAGSGVDAVPEAFATLVAESAGPIAVRWDEVTGTPQTLYGTLSAPLSAVSEGAARRFFTDHAALFRMRPDLDDLALSRTAESPLGQHVSFQQVVRGVPVHGPR